MILLEERVIQCKADMDAVERFVMAQLKCENNRCAFFRSRDYVVFRIAAMYRDNVEARSVYCERLCLRMHKKTIDGGDVQTVVSVFLNDDCVFEVDAFDVKSVSSDHEDVFNKIPNKRKRSKKEDQ